MENRDNMITKDEEIQFLRKMLLDTSKLSKDWLKSLKIIVATLALVLISGIIACAVVCNIYLKLAYDSEGYEKQNTTTNVNKNINENTSK